VTKWLPLRTTHKGSRPAIVLLFGSNVGGRSPAGQGHVWKIYRGLDRELFADRYLVHTDQVSGTRKPSLRVGQITSKVRYRCTPVAFLSHSRMIKPADRQRTFGLCLAVLFRWSSRVLPSVSPSFQARRSGFNSTEVLWRRESVGESSPVTLYIGTAITCSGTWQCLPC
jgi:hypothetical protein